MSSHPRSKSDQALEQVPRPQKDTKAGASAGGMEAADLSTPGEGQAELGEEGEREEKRGRWQRRRGVPGEKPEGEGRERSHAELSLWHAARKGHVCPECGDDESK